MPPPSLSITTIRTGVGDVAQGGEAADVVQQAEVAGDDRGRAAAGVGGADPGGEEAVDAVGAAVAEEEGVGLDWGQEGLLVADRHARGGVDEVAVAVGAAEGQVEAGLGQLVAGPPAPLRAPRARLARPRASAPAPARARLAKPRCPARGQLGRVGAQQCGGAAGRLVPAAAGSTTIWSAPDAASQVRSGLLVGISPKRRTRSGSPARGSARRAAGGRRW